MKVLVPIKRVPDPYSRIRLAPDGATIDTAAIKFEINPFDEIAVEEAVRMKERDASVEIVVVSIGRAECEEQLRKALAIGADRAIRVDCVAPLDSLGVAKTLARIVERESPNLVLMGKQAIDDDNNQAGQMLAALLDWPQATFASRIELSNGNALVTRETDTGQESLEFPLPAVITTDLRLNEPRYVALPGIIKARSKPLEALSLDDVGAQPECRVAVISMRQPPPRTAGRRVSSVDELIEALKTEKGLLKS